MIIAEKVHQMVAINTTVGSISAWITKNDGRRMAWSQSFNQLMTTPTSDVRVCTLCDNPLNTFHLND